MQEKGSKTHPILVKDVNEIAIGSKKITKYEKARVIAARALQLAMGAPPLIDVSKVSLKDPVVIAEKEFELGVLPMFIKRELPNGEYQLVPVKVLIEAEKKKSEYVRELITNIFGESE